MQYGKTRLLPLKHQWAQRTQSPFFSPLFLLFLFVTRNSTLVILLCQYAVDGVEKKLYNTSSVTTLVVMPNKKQSKKYNFNKAIQQNESICN